MAAKKKFLVLAIAVGFIGLILGTLSIINILNHNYDEK